MNILEQIKSPDLLKGLSNDELCQLATEIREVIINTVAKNGGHLAPSLGTVELTLALHRVFNCPKDKIIWDVGHQAYAHKLITGRLERFNTLRQEHGITGFPNRNESEYDAFGVGHASTSISAALGMAVARDLDESDANIIAVIGDGALTGGEAFEGLNNAGISKRRLIVILNDNEMSISPNVGALSEYLSWIRIDEKYRRAKADVSKLLKKIPKIGETIWQTANYVKDGVFSALIPGGLFEAFGFSYIGPVNGNNLDDLISVLEKIKMNMDGPILLHVRTKKGLGYKPAETMPAKFHGIGKFDVCTGKPLAGGSSIPSYTSIFSKTLIKLADKDKDITAITAAMPSGTGLQEFAKTYPERCFDVGIAEEHAVTFAAGIATMNKKPVVAIYSTFIQRAYDQIIHDVALQNLPVIFCLDRAGLVGEDGPTHHGIFDIAYMRAIPNMIVMAPKDENELQHMMYSALNYNAPCAIRYPRGCGCGVDLDEELKVLPLGKAEVIQSDNPEIVVFAYGSMVQEAIKASAILAEDDIKITIINLRFAKPLDKSMVIKAVKNAKFVITVEEGVLAAGIGSAIVEIITDEGMYNIPIKRLGLKDEFIEQASRADILKNCNLTADDIVNEIKIFKNNEGV